MIIKDIGLWPCGNNFKNMDMKKIILNIGLLCKALAYEGDNFKYRIIKDIGLWPCGNNLKYRIIKEIILNSIAVQGFSL